MAQVTGKKSAKGNLLQRDYPAEPAVMNGGLRVMGGSRQTLWRISIEPS